MPSLFISLLPVYLVGNVHCAGMCGPLVFLLGRHPSRYYYFLGRMLSFTAAGFLAGLTGEILGSMIEPLIPSLTILFGALLCLGALMPFSEKLKVYFPFQKLLGSLPSKEGIQPIFLFGLLTIFLPCGQTLLVFSACAISGGALAGALNGLAFACLTSPALFFSMHATHLFPASIRKNRFLPIGAFLIAGSLMILRGIAEGGWISHAALSNKWHLVLF